MMPLKYGLLEAWQSSLGVEVPLGARFTLSTEAFYNYMNPTIFDLSTNAATVGTGANTTLIPTSRSWSTGSVSSSAPARAS